MGTHTRVQGVHYIAFIEACLVGCMFECVHKTELKKGVEKKNDVVGVLGSVETSREALRRVHDVVGSLEAYNRVLVWYLDIKITVNSDEFHLRCRP